MYYEILLFIYKKYQAVRQLNDLFPFQCHAGCRSFCPARNGLLQLCWCLATIDNAPGDLGNGANSHIWQMIHLIRNASIVHMNQLELEHLYHPFLHFPQRMSMPTRDLG